jgi:hypothetical protein
MAHRSGHLMPLGVRNDQSAGLGTCPGSTPYFGNYCYYVAAGSSVSQEWEEEYGSSSSLAGQPVPGNWRWKFCHTYKAENGKGYKLSTCSWGPNPANPNTQTITMASGAPTSPASGPPPYYATIEACSNSSPYGKGYCDGPYEIGVMVLSGSGS